MKEPLVVTRAYLNALLEEQYRLFQQHTNNVRVIATKHNIMLVITAPEGLPFITPDIAHGRIKNGRPDVTCE